METARIWYIDTGANIEFQLFGPMLGAVILAVCKEFMKKVIPFPNFIFQWASCCGNSFPQYSAELQVAWQVLELQVCKTFS